MDITRVRNIFMTVGVIYIFSFIFTWFSGFIMYLLNFAVFLTYDTRQRICVIIASILFIVLFYLFSLTDGYNLTCKLRFDFKAQIRDTAIGFVIYAILTSFLLFVPMGILKIVYHIYYLNFFKVHVMLGEPTSQTVLYTVVVSLAEIPLHFAIRILGLWVGNRRKIAEAPAFEELNELVLSERNAPKLTEVDKPHSWRDSVDHRE